MKSIAVFCGSSSGHEPAYEEYAALTGKKLATLNLELVYGGARVGLMGAVADAALKVGGKVTGIMPRFLKDKEIEHIGLTRLILVDTMHERKSMINDLSDGFIVMPGGYGSMDEFFEILTWAQLGLHQKPVAVLNLKGFYDPLIQLVDSMVEKGFLKPVNREMLLVEENIDDLIEKMSSYRPPAVTKWITKDKT